MNDPDRDHPLNSGSGPDPTASLGSAGRAAKAFAGVNDPVSIQPLGTGNINETFVVRCPGRPRRLLQRINRRVFPDPVRVVENVRVVTEYLVSLEEEMDHGVHLRLLPARSGGYHWRDPDGEVWRLLTYIEAAAAGTPPTPAAAFEGGRLLASFHRRLAGLDPDRLATALPGFHDLPGYCRRYRRLRDSCGRQLDPELRSCLREADRRLGDQSLLIDAAGRGAISRQVIHGDPKADNMLFDRSSGTGLVLIDLDTVMAGFLQQDLGDCLRSFGNPAGEKPREGDRVEVDLRLCRQVLEGYGRESAPLRVSERHLVYQGLRLLTYELAVRFLSDYLDGNRYFKVTGPGDNLQRAQVQFQLLDSIERQRPELEKLIEETLPVTES